MRLPIHPCSVLAFFLAGSIALVAAPDPHPAPVAPIIPVVDDYWGVKVTDNYRWLEDWSNPAVRAWSDAENAHAREFLDNLPYVAQIRQRVTALEDVPYVSYLAMTWRGGRLFALKSQPPKQQPFLVVLKSAEDAASEQIVLDPNTLDPTGGTTIDFFVPSRDGKYVAVSLSRGGSESGDVHVYETATGKEIGETVPRVNGGTAGGSVAWNAGGTGFYYTRYPRGQECPAGDLGFYQQIYFHQLGTPTAGDHYELGRDFPKIAEVSLITSDDGQFILARVANGDGGECAHYIRHTDGSWTQLDGFADKISQVAIAPDNALYLLSHAGAERGQLLRLPNPSAKLSDAVVVVPQSDAVIDDFLPTATRLYVTDELGGPTDLRVFDALGHPLPPVPILPVSSVGGLARLDGDDILYVNTSYLNAVAWYHYHAAAGVSTKTALYNNNPVDFSDCEVLRAFATSKDGTKIPLTLIQRKNHRPNPATPVLLYGYGGYGINLGPYFSPIRRMWLDQDAIWVVANLRGGGEYGEAWHHAGYLTHKQNVFDDFDACMDYLVQQGYTSRDHLAIMGGSNGGLLMGAVYTQHPDKFRVCVSYVGIYDMLRVELSPNGLFNVTEFGSVKDPEQFKALYAYSPYHHVVDGTAYPPVLFLTGANDPRVEPWHSRKMTARLQAADPAGTILLRTSANSGHGIGTSLNERIEEDVDVYSFLFDELGVPFQSGAPTAPPSN
jgi:prolyl oligopeptidase